eukprot:scpid43454/ scgid4958/ E3 ubiquitin-protein ligase TRIM33; Ectodermin homolog; Transcription intermediary factor 1-gamma; Tripartite motif-containing protein 33
MAEAFSNSPPTRRSPLAAGGSVKGLCVACHKPADRLKILNCLHAMCVPCIREHVGKDATVSCFQCLCVAGTADPGVRLEDSLAEWPRWGWADSTNAKTSSADPELRPFCQSPECEGEFEPAVSLCADCGLYLCEDHETFHLKKKSSRGHQISRLNDGFTAPPPTQTPPSREGTGTRSGVGRQCSFHPNHAVKSYCSQCKLLACERCLEQRHAHCSEGFEDIETAAESTRTFWKGELCEHASFWRKQLDDDSNSIASRTAQINDKVEELSAQISADFEKFIKKLRQRQDDLLNELDTSRWSALKDLERQSEIVKQKVYQRESCERLVRYLDDANLLTAVKILDAQVDDVVDYCMDASLCDLPQVDFSVSYDTFADDESCHVPSLGKFLIDGFVEASAETKRINTQPTFDQFTLAADDFSLSDDGHEVSNTGEGWAAFSTLGSYCHGEVICVFRVRPGRGDLAVGVRRESCHELEFCSPEKPFLGWCNDGGDGNSDYCVGDSGKLGQPWQDDDCIAFRLDCNAHTLTARHSRSGQIDRIAVPAGRLCFAAELDSGASIKIVS